VEVEGGGGGWEEGRRGGGEAGRRDGGWGKEEKVKIATKKRERKRGGEAMGKHGYEEREGNKVVSIIYTAQDRVNPRGLRKRKYGFCF
jgi:hypothetical protein